MLIAVVLGLPFLLASAAVARFLQGFSRLALLALLIATPAALILFVFSPLPRTWGLTTDAGYDAASLMPLILVAAGVALVGAVGGIPAGFLWLKLTGRPSRRMDDLF